MIIISAMKTSFDLLWISYVRQRHLNACEVGPCEVVAWEFILENVWVAWPLDFSRHSAVKRKIDKQLGMFGHPKQHMVGWKT